MAGWNHLLKSVISLLSVAAVGLICTTAFAEPAGRNSATVIGKAPNCIMITDHMFKMEDRYVMVTSSATIVDENGKIISLAQLKLPCSVKMNIVRRKEQVDPELGRLKVVEYGLLPSRAFTMKKKFERLPE